MFGFLGLMGAIMAGFMVDALTTPVGEQAPDDHVDNTPEGASTGDLLDKFGTANTPDAGMPVSDAADLDEVQQGDDGNDILASHGGDDTLAGAAGNDQLGGRGGADQFAVHDIAQGDRVAQIMDFNRDEDSLVLIYDPSHHADPQITVASKAGSPHATVMLDGVPVAQVMGGVGLVAADVILQAA